MNNNIGIRKLLKIMIVFVVLSSPIIMSASSASAAELRMSSYNQYWFDVFTNSGAWQYKSPNNYLLDYDKGGRYLYTPSPFYKSRTYYNEYFGPLK